MNEHSVPHPCPDIVFRQTGEESVLLHLRTKEYYSLNLTGTVFWQLLDGSHSLADCAQRMAEDFEVPPGQALQDLIELAGELQAAGLIDA